jgi:hypothetical protein
VRSSNPSPDRRKAYRAPPLHDPARAELRPEAPSTLRHANRRAGGRRLPRAAGLSLPNPHRAFRSGISTAASGAPRPRRASPGRQGQAALNGARSTQTSSAPCVATSTLLTVLAIVGPSSTNAIVKAGPSPGSDRVVRESGSVGLPVCEDGGIPGWRCRRSAHESRPRGQGACWHGSPPPRRGTSPGRGERERARCAVAVALRRSS